MSAGRQRIVGLLLGLVVLLAACDAGGAVFDLDPPAGTEPAGEQDQPSQSERPSQTDQPSQSEQPGDGGGSDEPSSGDEPQGSGGGAGNPFADTDGFYVPDSQAAQWVRANAGDPRADVIEEKIARTPSARWMIGGGDVAAAVDDVVAAAAAENQIPAFVAYNIPGRDCGQYSAGGANGADAYREWISDFASAIGDRPAIVILEPDALAGMDCLSDANQRDRLDLLRYAVEQFADAAPSTWTYIDAGHARWHPADVMAGRLEAAGVEAAHGFALNVSNFHTTADSVEYGDAVNAALGSGKPYLVDTSRNGNGSNGEWCNPAGRAIGAPPAIHELGVPGLELELWVKLPGESDGDCGIGAGTSAGQFVPDIAFELAGG